MENISRYFGSGDVLTPSQMALRASVVFLIAIVLLRISGRRSFGLHMPIDNVISILLGAILSRGVVGASPFWSTIAASLALVCLHRIFGMLAIYNKTFDLFVKGKEKIVYDNGEFNIQNMHRCMLTHEDLMEGVRAASHSDSLENIRTVYVERDGKISVVKKYYEIENKR